MKTAFAALLVLLATGFDVGTAAALPDGATVKSLEATPRSQLSVHGTTTPPDTLPDGRVRLLWLDFGIAEPGLPPWVWTLDGSSPNSTMAWLGGMVRLIRRENARERPGGGDLYEGDDATFALALEATGNCRVRLILGDELEARGPFDVSLPDGVVATGIRTRPGQYRDLEFEAATVGGRLPIRITGTDCGTFGILGLVVHAPPGSLLTTNLFNSTGVPLTPGAPGSASHGPGGTTGATAIDSLAATRELLGKACDFLLASRPNEGCFSMAGSWYQSAYAIRTLLAGGRLLGVSAYTDAAIACLDRFVDEQRTDGGWCATYFGTPGCPRAAAEVSAALSANLADGGSAALALAAASAWVESPRRERYREAGRRYADQVVLPNQLESGAFVNLRFMGVDHRHPYSVATGIQAGHLSALYAVTGEARYLASAERAARFLLAGFQPTGRYAFHRHDQPGAVDLQSIRFGDLYYILEGLEWVHRYTGDAGLSQAIEAAFDGYLWGPGGLSASRSNEVLWKASNVWEASKQGALLAVLSDFHRMTPPAADEAAAERRRRRHRDTGEWIRQFVEWLGRPENAEQLGFLVDVASPKGEYAFPATGFAGIGLAAVIDPEALFPAR